MVSFKTNMGASAQYGIQSVAPVISAWPELSSKGTTTYEIQLHSDGVLTCNCPGWVSRKTRDCKHVKNYQSKATMILRGQRTPEFVASQKFSGAPQVKIVEKVVEKIKFVEKVVEKEMPYKEPTIEVRGSKRLLRTIPQEK